MSLFQIKSPCDEDWSSMKIGLRSRHCESCKKDVIDFTKMSREEILTYLLGNIGKQVCGRIREGQLDFHHTDILVTVNSLSHKERNTNFAFYLLSIGTLLMLNQSEVNAKIHQPITSIATVSNSTQNTKKEQLQKNKDITAVIEIDNVENHGLIDVAIDSTYSKVFEKPDKMPEFVGGIDSLMKFMKENLRYPEFEAKNKIEGTIYASFIVNKNGSLSDISITESVTGSKNFNAEVIRVLKLMPKWMPGENNGKKVKVRYYLPVKFKL